MYHCILIMFEWYHVILVWMRLKCWLIQGKFVVCWSSPISISMKNIAPPSWKTASAKFHIFHQHLKPHRFKIHHNPPKGIRVTALSYCTWPSLNQVAHEHCYAMFQALPVGRIATKQAGTVSNHSCANNNFSITIYYTFESNAEYPIGST